MLPTFFSPALFEVPRGYVEPIVQYLRLANTTLDFLFYDVNAFRADLSKLGWDVEVDEWPLDPSGLTRLLKHLDLSALSNPEGAILVVDAAERPYVKAFRSVAKFLDDDAGTKIGTISITGVGSSALGSAAFAWNLSTALGKPVAAIVPGYGVADVIQQALGGWFGFEMYSYWIKQPVQDVLANTQPQVASIGRALLATTPGHKKATTGAPVFRSGSGSSDVLHAILKSSDRPMHVFGHSKGALVIANAILDLPAPILAKLSVVTFGCSVSESARVGSYEQFLGVFDLLGIINSGGNAAEHLVDTWHSTNTEMPYTMHVASLSRTLQS